MKQNNTHSYGKKQKTCNYEHKKEKHKNDKTQLGLLMN